MKTMELGIVIAALGCVLAAGCDAAPRSQHEGIKALGRSGTVWTHAPIQPWDNVKGRKSDFKGVTGENLTLTRKGKAGEVRRYMIRRQHLMLDRRGKIVYRTVCEGIVRRTLTRELEPGVWADRTEWERFAASPSQIPTLDPKPAEVIEARGISYEYSPRTFDYLNPPGDYNRIKNPMTAYEMKVVGMDVAGFDAIVLGVTRSGPHSVGDVMEEGAWNEGSKIGDAGNREMVGSYKLGESVTSVIGITHRNSIPCALLWYSAEGNRVKQESKSPQLAFRMNGTEYFRGTVAVSLKDGHIVAAELWGPVVNTIEVGIGSQSMAELPIAAVLQQVSMWEIPVTRKR